MVGKTPSAHASCRSGPATAQVGVGCTKCNNMQLQPCITTTDKIVVSTGIVGVIAAAINATCVRVATAFNYSMPLRKLHWLLHQSLQHAPMLYSHDLVSGGGGGGGCSCTFGTFGASHSNLHRCWFWTCNLCWWCFSFCLLAHIFYLHMLWSWLTATCAGGAFLKAICANTLLSLMQLALCGSLITNNSNN